MPSIINAATSGGLISTADTSGVLQLQTASTTALTITAAQNVGIGTASPATKLVVKGTHVGGEGLINIIADSGTQFAALSFTNNVTQKGIVFHDNTNNLFYLYGAAGQGLAFNSNDAERMRITSAGDIGIGTSAPQMKLDINGGIRVQSIANPSSGAGMELAYDGTQGIMQAYSNRATLTPVPVYLVTGQLKFPPTQVPSADANTLDDYEEGTWTPSVTAGITSPTYSIQVGSYTKIGNVVTFTLRIAVSGGTRVGSLLEISLPFVGRNISSTPSSGFATWAYASNVVNSLTTNLPVFYFGPNTTTMYAYKTDGANFLGNDLATATPDIYLSGSYLTA